MVRRRSRCGIVLILVVLAGQLILPTSAVALSARMQADRKASGHRLDVEDLQVKPLAGGVVESGTIAPGSSEVYQYEIALAEGDRLTCSLTAADGTDFDLHLLWPDWSDPDDPRLAAAALGTEYPDVLSFDCAAGGTYLLVLKPIFGYGDFTIEWSVSTASGDGQVVRVWGGDRFATAVNASERTFSSGSSRDVVLASGTSFADSLAACGLAGALGCPLLLTQAAVLPAVVAAEASRLGVDDVHIVGGVSAVSAAVQSALVRTGYEVFRYQGADRYSTAATVAQAVIGLSPSAPQRAFVARGDLFADALVVSPLAYSQGYPVLLTRSDALSDPTAGIIATGGFEEIIIAGRETAVSAAVAARIGSLMPDPDSVARLGGADRYATAVLIADYGIAHFWALPDYTGVASGVNFPDAVCGGAALGAQGGVLVLTTPSALGLSAREFISRMAGLGLVDHALVFGGTSALSARVENELAAEVSR